MSDERILQILSEIKRDTAEMKKGANEIKSCASILFHIFVGIAFVYFLWVIL